MHAVLPLKAVKCILDEFFLVNLNFIQERCKTTKSLIFLFCDLHIAGLTFYSEISFQDTKETN